MSEVSTFAGVANDIDNKYMYEAYSSTVNGYNKMIDDMFYHLQTEKISKNKSDKEAVAKASLKYNKDDYTRFTAASRRDISHLVSHLRDNDINDFVVTSHKINGHYILEINREYVSKVYDYEDTHDIKIKNYTEEVLDDSNSYTPANQALFLVVNNLESLGHMVNTANSMAYRADSHQAQMVTVRTDSNHDVAAVLYGTKEIKIKDDKVFLGGKEVTNKNRAVALAISYEEAVNKHNSRKSEIEKNYKTKSDNRTEFEKIYHHGENNSYYATKKEQELKALDGASYKMYGTQFAEIVSAYTGGNLTALVKKLNQEHVYAREGNGEAIASVMNKIRALEKDFENIGIVVDGNLTESELLKINNELVKRANSNNIKIIDIFGKFDSNALKKLSAKDLEALGLSRESVEVLCEINEKGAYGYRFSDSLMFMGLQSFTKKVVDDEDIQQLINSTRTASKYGLSAVKQAQKGSESVKLKRAEHKAKKESSKSRTGIEGNKRNAPTKNKKPRPELSDKKKASQEKWAEKQEAKWAKTKKKRESKGLVNRLRNAENKLRMKAADTKLGKGIIKVSNAVVGKISGVVASVVGWYFIACASIIVIILITTTITSFFGSIGKLVDKALAPNDYTETISYYLYEALSEQEEAWLNDLNNFSDLDEVKAELTYSSRYYSLDYYLGKFNSLSLDEEGDFVNNPFWRYLTADKYTSTVGFTGTESVDILANANSYNAEDSGYGSTGNLYTAESGHTSNIKDIICMTDVMYAGNSADWSDSALSGVMSMSPAQLRWQNFCTDVQNAFKWIGYWLSSFCGNETWYEDYLEEKVIMQDYQTVSNYAMTLFEVSHQSEITFDLEYFDTIVKTTGTQTVVSHLDVCSDPDTVYLKLGFDENKRIHPKADGYYTDTGVFDVNITTSDMIPTETPCIWNGMSATQAHFNKAKASLGQSSAIGSKTSCWTRTESKDDCYQSSAYNSHGYYTDVIITEESTSGYPAPVTDLSDARWTSAIADKKKQIVDFANNKLQEAIDSGIYKEAYMLNSAKTIYTHISYVIPEKMSVNKTVFGYSDKTFMQEEMAEGTYNVTSSNGVIITYTNERLPNGKYLTTTAVRIRAGNPVVKNTETLTLSCKGHAFEYCSGHINVHKTGIVFSASNEQLAITGIQDEELNLATDYDLAGIYGSSIVGKINDDTLDYSTIETAKKSGCAESPLLNAQGSISGMYGLNLLVKYSEDDGDAYWGEGMLLDNTSAIHLFKDIFDVDTAILKGCNVFPTKDYTEFEGWTSDNMILALNKLAQDWNELYGFDIPWNICGEKTLSESDIDTIVSELEDVYGNKLTASREEAIRLALSLVGIGNTETTYSHSHAFLCFAHKCRSLERENNTGTVSYIDYTVSCTTSGSLGFCNYVYYKSDRLKQSSYPSKMIGNEFTGKGVALSSNYSNALPGDVIYHTQRTDNWQTGLLHNIDFTSIDMVRTEEQNAKTKYAIFLGVLDNEIILTRECWTKDEGDYTEAYMTLPAGVPLYITLDIDNEASRITTGCVQIKGITSDNSYSWITNPDARTKVFNFDTYK